VITLQRLVGNAAVVELLGGRKAGEAGAAAGMPEIAGIAADAAAAGVGGAAPGLAGAAEAAALGAGGAALGADGAAAEGAAAGAAGGAPSVAGAAIVGAATGAGGAALGADGAAAAGAASGAAAAAPGAVGAGAEGEAAGAAGAPEAAANGAAAGAVGATPGAVEAATEGAAAEAAGGVPGKPEASAVGAPKKGGEAATGGAAGGSPKEAGAAHGAGGGAGGHHAGAAAGAPEPAGASAAEAGADSAAGGEAGPAEAAPRRDTESDPNFQKMKGAAAAAGGRAKVHEPAAAGAAAAQGAAHAPGNDVASQAQAAQVEDMAQQQPGTFDRAAFIAAVRKAIDAAAPKNLEEADDFKGSGKVAAVKDEVGDLVKGGKKDSEKDIKQATEAAPDTGKAKPKEVVPMKPDAPEAPSASVGAAGAMPGPRPPEETDLSQGPAEVDKQMHDANVTEEQLQKSNEPEFTGALAARQEAKEHAATAPAGYRAQEQDVLAKGRTEAQVAEGMHLKGMHGSKMTALAKAHGQKDHAKAEDEAKRAKVAADIQGIYDRTKSDVTGILTGLDGKVESTFSAGEESARKDFENYVGEKMDAYKEDRYGGWLGGAKWLKDKLFGMPDEVNVFYTQGRDRYLAAMDGVIGKVADLVGSELASARLKIAKGRAQVHDYVTKLPKDLQKVGKDAEGKLGSQWEALSGDIDSKQEALVDTIAQKYVASRDALDSRIEELKAANRGLVAKALDAVVGVVKTILKLKDMLLNVLAKAAEVIGDIITDPIGFLGNLVDGVKSGLSRFVDNIGTHLKEGFFGWLFGAIGSAGITLPKTFDLSGIFELVMDVLGLSYRAIRARVAKVVGGPVVDKMEQTVDVFKTLVTKGAAGLWDWIKEKIGDFEDMVLGGIKEWVIEKVIKGGITWLLSLLNPAAAFIKACKAIYDIVMFIVERGAQIIEFVNSVLDSIGAIAKGNISAAADKVENALAKAIPLAISFLASLLGLGGISEKVKEGIDKVRKPIEKVVDTVVMGAVKTFRKMFGPAIDWVKNKAAKGKAWVKGKVEAGKAWAADKAKSVKDRLTGQGAQAAEGGAAEGTHGAAGGAEAQPREAKHRELATAAAGELALIDGGAKGYKETRADVQAKALELEHRYTALLDPGIAMKVHFRDQTVDEDAVDQAVELDVVIAPNATTVPARTPVAPGCYPTGEDPTTRTLPELWADCNDRVPINPTETGTERRRRARLAERQLVVRLGNVPMIRALLTHERGREPRPFTSVAHEDGAMPQAHTTERHVFGMGIVRDIEALALRVCQHVPAACPGRAGAFDSLADANSSVRAGLNTRMGTPAAWDAIRAQLLTMNAIPITEPLVGAGTGLEKTDGTPGRVPLADMPNWYPGGTGTRPLYPGDSKLTAPAGLPLTQRFACTEVYIRLVPDANAPGGWYVNSAWPQ
jgi:hypothetical protein